MDPSYKRHLSETSVYIYIILVVPWETLKAQRRQQVVPRSELGPNQMNQSSLWKHKWMPRIGRCWGKIWMYPITSNSGSEMVSRELVQKQWSYVIKSHTYMMYIVYRQLLLTRQTQPVRSLDSAAGGRREQRNRSRSDRRSAFRPKDRPWESI